MPHLAALLSRFIAADSRSTSASNSSCAPRMQRCSNQRSFSLAHSSSVISRVLRGEPLSNAALRGRLPREGRFAVRAHLKGRAALS